MYIKGRHTLSFPESLVYGLCNNKKNISIVYQLMYNNNGKKISKFVLYFLNKVK